MRCFLPVLILALVQSAFAYQIGAGIYDMTGPSVEINFMGYAVPSQRGSGIHQRLRARSFIFADDNKRTVFVSVDGGMGSDLVKMKVLEKVSAAVGNGIYTTASFIVSFLRPKSLQENVAISGTHTHSGPAGFLQYILFQITSLGFVQETFDAWVNGIANSIIMAHKNLQEGKVYFAQGDLYQSNINRSPSSYLLNPEDERNAYPEGDTDKNMFLLKMTNRVNKPIAVLNWFAVHGTAMNNTNTLTSGDNKGYASYALERDYNGADSMPGMGPFVSAFASTNLGDVSPNTNGAKCIDTGLPCDFYHSTCSDGKSQKCIAFGPGKNGDMFESTQIIGDKQYQFVKTLIDMASEQVSGPIDYRHSFVNMPELNVTLADGSSKKLCKPAMGYSFAAGTTDGPGMFGFTQGTTTENPFWDKVRDFLSEPTEEEMACQAPKPILLNTGDCMKPYQWDPDSVPVQILRIGNVYILAAPAEFTTMAGRRLRNAVRTILESKGGKAHVTISGLTNTYASYVTTYEEYQAQRYEAASTIFGPHTLEGYIQEFSRLARDMVNGVPSTTGEAPPDLSDSQIQLIPEPKFDRVAKGASFGDVITDVKAVYTVGEIASAVFHAANPRNNQKTQDTYLTVERELSTMLRDNKVTLYRKVAWDGDWSTKFQWRAGPEDPLDLGISKQSQATISWDSTGAEPGIYRLCYHGDHKLAANAKIIPFTGCSASFELKAAAATTTTA